MKQALRSRGTRFVAATAVVGLTAGAVMTAGIGSASAAEPIKAQAVGRFIDGSAGGMPIESLVNLKEAHAKAAPNSSERNPADVELFNQADIPIGDSFKQPGGGVFNVGAANQLAQAKTNGYSYGASGAVDNTGGAELTDKAGAFPSNGTIKLDGSALGQTMSIPGLPTIPGLPDTGTGALDASSLGGVTAKIGAVQALAQTATGGEISTPQSSLAGLQIVLGSPALAAILKQLKTLSGGNPLDGLTGSSGGSGGTGGLPTSGLPTSGLPTGGLPTGGIPITGLPTTLPGSVMGSCALTDPTPKDISLDDGAVVISPADASITIDLAKLVQVVLGKDITKLDTSNFDLVDFLVKNLPSILSDGLSNLVTGITDSLQDQFTACLEAVGGSSPLSGVADQIDSAINMIKTSLLDGLDSVTEPLKAGSAGPLSMLADGLKGALDIGLNVQSGPNVQPRDKDYPYTSQLAATPNQATNVVKGQSLVRAIEIDLLDASGGGTGGIPTTIPTSGAGSGSATGSGTASGTASAPASGSTSAPASGTSSSAGAGASSSNPIGGITSGLGGGALGGNAFAARPLAAAAAPAGSAAIALAFGNAAAGPAEPGSVTTSSPGAPGNPGTAIPTGVPAGAAGSGGGPLLPLSLLLLGLVVIGGGALSFRLRGKPLPLPSRLGRRA